MITTEPREQTAYHEAGHAVATIVQGLTVNKVTIRRRGDYLGVCVEPGVVMYKSYTRRERRQIARAVIIGCYAGIEAERLAFGDAAAGCMDACSGSRSSVRLTLSVIGRSSLRYPNRSLAKGALWRGT